MSDQLLNLLSTGGAGIAVTVVTVIFLRFLREERNQLMADRRDERKEFLQRLDDISLRLVQLAERLDGAPCRTAGNMHPQDTKPPRRQG